MARLKAPSLISDIEFRAQLSDIAQLQNEKARLVAHRDGLLNRLLTRYAAQIEPLDAMLKAKLSLVEKYADAHRATLLPKDKKSADTALATFGWRTGNRTVTATGKRWTLSAIVAALLTAGLRRYVRSTPEVAKDLILADCKDDRTLTIPAVAGEEREFPARIVPLADFGLQIIQKETFFVEPKAESGETLKATEAVA